jgi:hypothetical protein
MTPRAWNARHDELNVTPGESAGRLDLTLKLWPCRHRLVDSPFEYLRRSRFISVPARSRYR